MGENKRLPGLTREEEEQHLMEVIEIAEENLARTKKGEQDLAEELHNLMESYGAKDVEALSMLYSMQVQYEEIKEDVKRCEKARSKPYFGRIDFFEKELKRDEALYIGKVGITKNITEPQVIDWRAPIASVYYENGLGDCSYSVKNEREYPIRLNRKRTYEIENDKLKDYYDSDVVANDELLTKYLAKNKRAVLGEIIATIQQEQNAIIRKSPKQNLIVQGAAGSGKTTVAMHRISYILYNYAEEFQPQDFYIVGSNEILLNYITSVLPDLDVYGVRQMTMEQLLIRLLYEDWDSDKMQVQPLEKSIAGEKGTFLWFQKLEAYCKKIEKNMIPGGDVFFREKDVLLTADSIEQYVRENPQISVQSKINYLNKRLRAKVQNLVIGKENSLDEEEKKEIRRQYRGYFGGKEWKGSIFKLYCDFLQECDAKTKIPQYNFDVYDLSALAYLYKRIKETEQIREASHVVIDEAQDFGMTVYATLKYCMRGCTFTVMGDVSQNIHYGYGLDDWECLKKCFLTGPRDSFSVLRKSYRNTIEISKFATEILQHGDFPIYPIEPIIRHGKEVEIRQYAEKSAIFEAMAEKIERWEMDGLETIAVVCRDEKEAETVKKRLAKQVHLLEEEEERTEFGSGVMVLPIAYTKGLEFDAVLLFDPSVEKYPSDDRHVKLLYVAATRALHELAVFYEGSLSEILAKPAQKKNQQYFKEESVKKEIIKKVQAPKNRNLSPRVQSKTQVQDKPIVLKIAEIQKESETRERLKRIKKPQYQFGDIPSSEMRRPSGHGRIDARIRWVTQQENGVEFVSNYGLLFISPISADIIRITFGAEKKRKEMRESSQVKVDWKWKELRDSVRIETAHIVAAVDKASGAVSFYDKQGKMLLTEKKTQPRQIEHNGKNSVWNFFDWPRSERIRAKSFIKDEVLALKNTAKYISYGEKSQKIPCILSNQGYGIAIEAHGNVMCCNIPMYGPYFYTEDTEMIDYFFLYGKTEDGVIEQYNQLQAFFEVEHF